MTWPMLLVSLLLGGLAQHYRVIAMKNAENVLRAHEWIDEIIKALENPDEEQGNESIGGLVDQRRKRRCHDDD